MAGLPHPSHAIGGRVRGYMAIVTTLDDKYNNTTLKCRGRIMISMSWLLR